MAKRVWDHVSLPADPLSAKIRMAAEFYDQFITCYSYTKYSPNGNPSLRKFEPYPHNLKNPFVNTIWVIDPPCLVPPSYIRL